MKDVLESSDEPIWVVGMTWSVKVQAKDAVEAANKAGRFLTGEEKPIVLFSPEARVGKITDVIVREDYESC